MEQSSSRFKALAVTTGFSLWFFLITTAVGVFSLEVFALFVVVVILVTQVFAVKLAKGLDVFAVINTKAFLTILYVCVISIYGIFFRFLRIDLLRLQKQKDTYWLEIEELKPSRFVKQY